jgi:RND family efflux transporter MFP subunit
MLFGAGVFIYVKYMGDSGGGAAAVKVQIASAREVVRLYDGSAKAQKSEGATLSFGEAGKVADVVAAGTDVKAGTPVATLEAFSKVEKELVDVRDRASFYEKSVQSAKAKNNEDEVKKAEAKVAEKQKLLAELQARATKLRLLAPSSGKVAEVLMAVGADAKPGAPVVRLGDNRITAEFKLPADDVAALKAGARVSVQLASGGAALSGRVQKSEGETAAVEVTDESGAVKPCDELRLVKTKLANVVPVPPAAVVKANGTETVFVLSGDQVRAHPVTVVDRSPSEVLVGTGLAPGDQVIVSGNESLKDGQKVTPH